MKNRDMNCLKLFAGLFSLDLLKPSTFEYTISLTLLYRPVRLTGEFVGKPMMTRYEPTGAVRSNLSIALRAPVRPT